MYRTECDGFAAATLALPVKTQGLFCLGVLKGFRISSNVVARYPLRAKALLPVASDLPGHLHRLLPGGFRIDVEKFARLKGQFERRFK